MGAIVIGASAGVGRAVADQLGRRQVDLVIAARDARDLTPVAADLRLRYGVDVTAIPLDLNESDAALEKFFVDATTVLPGVETVVITAGEVAQTDEGVDEWDQSARLLTTNFLAPMKLAGSFIDHFERRGSGTLVLVSSIAAAVPRDRNVAYAAAKAALESFGSSMRHRTAGTGVSVQIYALGYVDTAMTRGLDLKLPVADPRSIAERIVDHLDAGSRFRYLPWFWSPVVRALQALPRPIYDRLSF